MKLEITMNKQRARQLYELTDRLSKLDVNALSEEQKQQRSAMIAKLQEEARSVAESNSWDRLSNNSNLDPEHLEYLKKQSEISRSTGLVVGDTVTLKDRPGFKGKIVHDWGGGDYSISGSGGGMSQSNNHRANARIIQKIQGVTEDTNSEYNDEAGMAESNLHTMARAVNGLLDTIQDNDNLPEWAQEKLAKAEMMVTSVWDYLLSQKEQGMDPKVEESKKPSPKLTAVNIKKTDPVSEEINTEAYERLQKVFAFKNYES